MRCDVGIRVLLTTKLIDTRFLGTEPQTPRRPEFHPEHPPSSTYAEVGQGGSLPCEVYSDFPPEIHWLKRITSPTPGAFLSQPRLPSDEEVESIQPQFVPNGTITIGDVKYQVLTGNNVRETVFNLKSLASDIAVRSGKLNERRLHFNFAATQEAAGIRRWILHLFGIQQRRIQLSTGVLERDERPQPGAVQRRYLRNSSQSFQNVATE